MSTMRIFIKAALIVIILSVILIFSIAFDLKEIFKIDYIENWLTGFGYLAPLIYMAVMAMAIVIFPIPSVPLDIAAGMIFGPLLGTVYSVIGATIGALLSFAISRYLGRELVEKIFRSHIHLCPNCSDRLLFKVILISRLIPIISFDIISYGAGLTKMSLRSFGTATFFGMIPLTFIYTYYGSIIVIHHWLGMALGLLLVIFFLILPTLIEEKNVFGLRKYFEHVHDDASPSC